MHSASDESGQRSAFPNDGKPQVESCGLDFQNPTTREIRSSSIDDVDRCLEENLSDGFTTGRADV